MHKVFLVVALAVVALGIVAQASPLSSEETLLPAQLNSDQQLIQKQGLNSDNSFGITFDNHDKEHRDRGYGYEKAYAYSRETAFLDFYDDKGALNAKDIVEKYGKSEE